MCAAPEDDAYRLIAESIPQLVWVADPAGRATFLNRRWEAYTGVPVPDLLDRVRRNGPAGPGPDAALPGAALIHPDDAAARTAAWEASVRTGEPHEVELRLRRADGAYRWHVSRGLPVRDAAGRVTGWFGTCTDVDDLHRAAAVLHATSDGFMSFDRAWRFTYLNPRGERFLQRAAADLLGKNVWAEFPEAVGSRFHAEYHACVGTGKPVEFEEYYPPLKTWFEVRAFPTPDGLSVYFVDSGPRHRAEQSLRDSEARFRLLFDRVPAPLFVYDRDTLRYLAVNDAAVAAYGYTRAEFLGMAVTDVRPPEDLESLLATVNRDETFTRRGVWRHRRKDGTVMEVDVAVHGTTLGGRPADIVLAQDVSASRKLEAHLRHAQKMEAVGRLAGGIAHDFNNLLTIMNGFAEQVAMSLPPDSDARRQLGEVLKAGDRAAELTRQLLSFAGNPLPRVGVLRLDALVADLHLLLTRVLGEGVRVEVAAEPGLWPVRADRSQVEQVLVNLAVNARDAMPAGGVLTVRLANVEPDAGPAAELVGAPPAGCVRLTVTDTGTGMDDATRARVFDPYFTTKESDRGSGLGLFVVYGIVRAHGGSIAVDSAPGRGTTFRLDWPAEPDAVPPGADPEPPPDALPPGTETVLVAEDEPGVRGLAAEVLAACGYRVLSAESGADALAAARGVGVDLLLTDVVMGEMGGRELAERLRADRPRVKVLYMSGYADDDVLRHGVLHDRVPFLPKPFTPAALAVKVRQVLDGAG